MDPPSKYIPIKICMVGDTCVGKSSIVYRIDHTNLLGLNKYTTIGSSFVSVKTCINDIMINFHLWDTAGQERFHSLVPMYFKGTKIFMVVFDLNNQESWENVEGLWMKMIQQHATEDIKDLCIILIGNKKDLKRKVSNADINSFCIKHNIECIKISAKTHSTEEIVQKCLVNGLGAYITKNPNILKISRTTNRKICENIRLTQNTQNTKKTNRKCSNKVECAS